MSIFPKAPSTPYSSWNNRVAVHEPKIQTAAPKRRSPRHVKAAARILHKEARRILRKHTRRIPAAAVQAIRASVAAVDSHRAAENWSALEDEAEVLDELLHQHASFARKSALRETLENVAIAVGVAVALRSCFYEPFKIPSGSMMPTLRTGDHIFVNKFVYGVQIPFTTHVVAEDMIDGISRGDVVVFRYPLDESEDFIKRVIGLPGDVVRVEGRDIWIQRGGEGEFEAVERTQLDRKCLDESGLNVVEHCRLFEERLDDHSYEVRYLTDIDPRGDMGARVFAVPEDRLLVMGDNRNLSHDSLQWTATVEAVSADSLVTVKDLRDLTAETLFTTTRPRGDTTNEDPSFDSVLYLADHRSPAQDLELEVWRAPALGVEPMFEALAGELEAGERAGLDAVLAAGAQLSELERDRVTQVVPDVTTVAYAKAESSYLAAWTLADADVVFRLRCGDADCRNPGYLALRISDVVGAWKTDHELSARELIEGQKSVRYSQHWRARDEAKERFAQQAWSNPSGKGPANQVHLRAWRATDEGPARLRAAGLLAVGATQDNPAQAEATLGEDAWIVEDPNRWSVVVADHPNEAVFVLECGKQRCKSRDDALELGKLVAEKLPAAARDHRRLRELLGQKDIGAWPETPTERRKLHEWDRVTLEGTVRGGGHTLSVRVAHKPEAGLEATIEEWRADLGAPERASNLGDNAWHAAGPGGHRYVIAVPQTDTALAVHCGAGLCQDAALAEQLAKRAADKALDPANFVDPTAERHQPYVPRGNVKGRAERIWLPFSRFWLKVR